MNWVQYWKSIILKKGVILKGWPLDGEVKNPATIHDVDSMTKLRDALQSGECFWHKMSGREREAAQEKYDEMVESGELEVKVRKPRKDKNVSRKALSTRSKAKGAAPRRIWNESDSGDSEDEQEKKQREREKKKKGDKENKGLMKKHKTTRDTTGGGSNKRKSSSDKDSHHPGKRKLTSSHEDERQQKKRKKSHNNDDGEHQKKRKKSHNDNDGKHQKKKRKQSNDDDDEDTAQTKKTSKSPSAPLTKFEKMQAKLRKLAKVKASGKGKESVVSKLPPALHAHSAEDCDEDDD
jgi:hypothetical protein